MRAAEKVEHLMNKGIRIPNPMSVEIGEDISIDRISGNGVTIYSGSKIYGPDTYISDGAQIGYEGPVTIEDCYLGPNVALKGGFFQEATFLEGAQCGLGSHVRKGTILEEQAGIAHTVGLKQTILFPFVTLGSLINFCDCLMAGGTSRKNHSEVGSSYIHFNFTPNQDKATPSLIGDVPNGVMLNKSPIFLGGQGGLVGPSRIAYGTVVAAGTICRKDQLTESHLVIESGPSSARIPLRKGGYRNLKSILAKNINYIGNICALKQWYAHVRSRFVGDRFSTFMLEGLLTTVQKGIDERVKQLGRLRDGIDGSSVKKETLEGAFYSKWDRIEDIFQTLSEFEGRIEDREAFIKKISEKISRTGKNYLKVIQGLDSQQGMVGSLWLQSIVDQVKAEVAHFIELN